MAATAEAQRRVDEPGWAAALWASLGALLAFRIAALWFNATDLFFDEAQYWSWSLAPDFGYYSKPPLIAWVIRAATAVCGPSEFCIRLPSPLVHTATALVVYGLAERLYGARTAFWSALAYATLPGVTASAGIISTDVLLLFFWALAIYATVRLLDGRDWWPALLLGLALGGGLNAKYAMAYFVACAAVWAAFSREARVLLRDARVHAALALAVLLILPNLAWNAGHGFATFAHTADNANWTGPLFNPGRMLEFVGAQFGVFGPILFAALLGILAKSVRRRPAEPGLMLACFSLPILAAVTVQAFLSRAHANWAAPAYIAGSVLATAGLLRAAAGWRWLRASFVLHGAVVALFALATALAGRVSLPGIGDPMARLVGWRELAASVAAVLDEQQRAGRPLAAVVTDDRQLTAELLYYLHRPDTPVLALRNGPRPRDHYELTRAFARGSPEPVLLVTLRPLPARALQLFAEAQRLADRQVAAGNTTARRVVLYRLSGYRGE